MQRPADTEKCGSCSHPFGIHFQTYDGKKVGCSHYVDDQRDGGPCYCKGFALIFRYAAPVTPTNPYGGEAYEQR